MRNSLLAIAVLTAVQAFGGGYPDKFVFVCRSYATDAQVAETSNIVYNAKACGYTGMMLICGRNYDGRWGSCIRSRGTMGAGYYDQTTPERTIRNARQWMESMNRTPGCRGILYTTWGGERGNYEFLPLFSKVVERYGKPISGK